MAINGCELDAIRSRAERGEATNQDCCDLLQYMSENVEDGDFTDKVEEVVDRAIKDTIDQSSIVRAVELAVAKLKTN